MTQDFLLKYPAEAARVLELNAHEHVAELVNELPASHAVPVLASMQPEAAAACMTLLDNAMLARLLGDIPINSAARIYRHLSAARKEKLSAQLPEKVLKNLQRYLVYPAASAGTLLNPLVDTLPENVTVAEALRRIERIGRPVVCEIYVINEAHQLVGVIELGRLLAADHHARVKEVMSRKAQPVMVRAAAQSLLSNPGWSSKRRLPVIDRDHSLLGTLDYDSLQNALKDNAQHLSRDPMENLLSLATLYWLTIAQLFDSLLNIGQSANRGPK